MVRDEFVRTYDEQRYVNEGAGLSLRIVCENYQILGHICRLGGDVYSPMGITIRTTGRMNQAEVV